MASNDKTMMVSVTIAALQQMMAAAAC